MKQPFIEIPRSTADEQRALFPAVVSGMETRAENIEKDLYVCWFLDFMLNRRPSDPVSSSARLSRLRQKAANALAP